MKKFGFSALFLALNFVQVGCGETTEAPAPPATDPAAAMAESLNTPQLPVGESAAPAEGAAPAPAEAPAEAPAPAPAEAPAP